MPNVVVFKVGDDVSTDVIYPGRYMATVLPTETPQYAFADLAELNGMLKGKLAPAGSFVVGGKNFGCGSSREHAPIAIKNAGIACVVARSFARIFYRNAVNTGLPIVETGAEIDTGDELEIDLAAGTLKNLTKGTEASFPPFPDFLQNIIDAGGLLEAMKKM